MSDCPDKFRHGSRSYCATCFPGKLPEPAPPCETFDPEAVRALLDALRGMPADTTVARLAQRVRDSECK
jgi:hypothetical protein